MKEEENILQAHYRIYNKLIFIVSCYDPDYVLKYIKNLNNKTFKNYFKIFKSDDPKEINEIYQKLDETKIMYITKLPIPELYDFNFSKDVYHIHIAIPDWSSKKDTSTYNEYTSNIKNIPIQKFVNVKDTTNIYNNHI